VLAERTGEVTSIVRGHLGLSRVHWAQGDLAAAHERLQEGMRTAQRARVAQALAHAQVWRARLHMAEGDLEQAAFELEQAATIHGVAAAGHVAISTAQILLQLVSEDVRGAAREVERLRHLIGPTWRHDHTVTLRLLEVLALWKSGAQRESLDAFGAVLADTWPEGAIRLIADIGAPINSVAAQWRAANRHLEADPEGRAQQRYAQRIEAALPLEHASRQRLPEPLTAREADVLAMLASGKTVAAIAEILVLAPTTVKTHIKHIYGKLAVRNRTEALAQARALRLLA
jgi:LuxR family maltose regulon positive regulatory protein